MSVNGAKRTMKLPDRMSAIHPGANLANGLLAGAGFPIYGALCAALVVGSNVILRPLVRAINRQPVDTSEVELTYVVSVVCRGSNAPPVRSLLVRGLESMPDIQIAELDSSETGDADRVEVTAKISSHKRREIALEYVVAGLVGESGVTRANWRSQTESV